jgi:hypothetical protein
MERMMHPGEVADLSDARKPILKIADIDVLHVEVVLPVEAYGMVKPGSQVDVAPEVAGSGKHVATVKTVDRILDAASGTFGVRLELPNKSHKLPAGVKCKALFPSIPGNLSFSRDNKPRTAGGNARPLGAAEGTIRNR